MISSYTDGAYNPASMIVEDDMNGNDEVMEVAMDRKLEQQICNAIDSRFLLQLVC